MATRRRNPDVWAVRTHKGLTFVRHGVIIGVYRSNGAVIAAVQFVDEVVGQPGTYVITCADTNLSRQYAKPTTQEVATITTYWGGPRGVDVTVIATHGGNVAEAVTAGKPMVPGLVSLRKNPGLVVVGANPPRMPARRSAVAYRGYLIAPVGLSGDQVSIQADGHHIGYAESIEDAKRIIARDLLGEAPQGSLSSVIEGMTRGGRSLYDPPKRRKNPPSPWTDVLRLTQKKGGFWSPDLVTGYPLFEQLKKEAGIKGSVRDADIDALLVAAGRRGITLETSAATYMHKLLGGNPGGRRKLARQMLRFDYVHAANGKGYTHNFAEDRDHGPVLAYVENGGRRVVLETADRAIIVRDF